MRAIFEHIDTITDLQFMALMFALYAVAYGAWWLFDRWVNTKSSA